MIGRRLYGMLDTCYAKRKKEKYLMDERRVDENDEQRAKKKEWKQIGHMKNELQFQNLPFTFGLSLEFAKSVWLLFVVWCQSHISFALSWSGCRQSIRCRFINCSFKWWQPNIFLLGNDLARSGENTKHQTFHFC